MSSYQKYLAERQKEKPRLNNTDLTFLRRCFHERASTKGIDVVVYQKLFDKDYYLALSTTKGETLFDLVLPDTYTVSEVLEIVDKKW